MKDGDAYIIDYDEWQAVLRVVRAAEAVSQMWIEHKSGWLEEREGALQEALEALPEHLRGE